MLQDLLPARQAAWQTTATFSGPPAEFWAVLAQAAAHGCVGELAVLYVREPMREPAREPATDGNDAWRVLAHWPAVDADKLPPLRATVPAALLAQARTGGVACGPAVGQRWKIGLLAFSAEDGQRDLVLAVHLGAQSLPEPEARTYLASFLGLPALYEAGRKLRGSERDAVRLAQALELGGRVLECPGFDQAALALCNDLAERFGAETVSLSWRAREGLRLRAISHAEKPDKRTELSALLEEAQQEALSQGVELAWPAGGAHVLHAHERYAQLQRPGHLLTLPLSDADAADPARAHLGALTLERQRAPFTAAEQWALRLICDLLLPALRMLEERSRPLPRRLAAELARSLPARLAPHTAAGRRLAAGLAVAAGAVLLVPVPTDVDGGAVVKADAMAFIGAPFDGYIESSAASLGAHVKAGELLFTLATRELALERSSILADMAQHTREAEKRRSANQLPEMLIAEAQAAQAAAHLQQVDYKLAQAAVRAPIAGVVVEGEPGKSIGGAVRRGETTMKIAALQALHVEAAVPERDLGRIAVGAPVRVKLIALPDQAYTMQVTRIIPAAAVKDGNNTFPARIEMAGAAPAPWRPGMSGVAKIEAGWQPLAWVATHRMVDYLRLVCWW